MSYCHDHAIPHSEFLEWDVEDKAKVMAYILEKAARCTQCGTAPWEWEENKFAYTPVEELCMGCYKKSVFQDTEGSKGLPGTNVRLVPTTREFKALQLLSSKKRERIMRRSKE
jgi:hypothetical protein